MMKTFSAVPPDAPAQSRAPRWHCRSRAAG
jgi:hypothetical protein